MSHRCGDPNAKVLFRTVDKRFARSTERSMGFMDGKAVKTEYVYEDGDTLPPKIKKQIVAAKNAESKKLLAYFEDVKKIAQSNSLTNPDRKQRKNLP